jgi:hypothetical protein
MKFFNLDIPLGFVEELGRYEAYLAEIAERLPAEALGFARAPWRYDHSHPLCPHDLRIDQILVQDSAPDDFDEHRAASVKVILRRRYPTGKLVLEYSGVVAYSLQLLERGKLPPRTKGSHGDWLIDEVRLSESGGVEHEIEFSNGGTWLVECATLSYQEVVPAGA